MKEYPAIKWMVKHGRRLAWGVLSMFLAGDIYGYLRTGVPELVVAGAILGAAGYAGVRVATELIELITDMLMPS